SCEWRRWQSRKMTNIEKHDLFRVSLIWDSVSSLQSRRYGSLREGDNSVNWTRWKREGDDGGSNMRTRLLAGCELRTQSRLSFRLQVRRRSKLPWLCEIDDGGATSMEFG
ncbi:hypothetical protein V8G54_010584, partial [Vigna mungo]